MAIPTDPQKQLAALASDLKTIGSSLNSLQAQLAATGATAGSVAASTQALAAQATTIAKTLPPVEPPPIPSGPKPIPSSTQLPILKPRSNTPYPFGMGQNAPQAAAWEKIHGPLGAVAIWTNLAQTWTWNEIRGGAAGNPEKLGNAFTNNAYSANLKGFTSHLNQNPHVPMILMHPLIPSVNGISNMGKKGNWQNPGIWKKIITEELPLWKSVWKDYGAHLCYWAVQNRRNCIGACIGWELTGRWYHWSIGPQWRYFPDCWRWLAESFYAGIESVDPSMVGKIHLEMRIAGGISQRLDGYSLRDIFPGRDFVRVLGMSMHETADDNWGTPTGFAAELKSGPNEVVELCREVGLPLGLDEFNVRSANHEPYELKSKAPSTALQNFFNWTRALPVPVAWACWLQSSTANALDGKWAGSQELNRQLNALRALHSTALAAAEAIDTRQEIAAVEAMDSEGAAPPESGSATA